MYLPQWPPPPNPHPLPQPSQYVPEPYPAAPPQQHGYHGYQSQAQNLNATGYNSQYHQYGSHQPSSFGQPYASPAIPPPQHNSPFGFNPQHYNPAQPSPFQPVPPTQSIYQPAFQTQLHQARESDISPQAIASGPSTLESTPGDSPYDYREQNGTSEEGANIDREEGELSDGEVASMAKPAFTAAEPPAPEATNIRPQLPGLGLMQDPLLQPSKTSDVAMHALDGSHHYSEHQDARHVSTLFDKPGGNTGRRASVAESSDSCRSNQLLELVQD